MSSASFQSLTNFIWSVADLLRGPYRPPQYERVMLPMTVLRRFDCVLAPTKAHVLEKYQSISSSSMIAVDKILNTIPKDTDGNRLGFHNHSQLDFKALKGDPNNIGRHLQDYINGFSENIRQIFDRFEFDKEIEKLEDSDRLYLVVSRFTEIDLHPDKVDNLTMGLVFEDLIRRFNETANETAGDHFTPREVIRLMVNLLLEPDGDILTGGSPIITICDPTCGTGGMLAEAQNWIKANNENAIVKVFGQDYNPRSYAVAASDLLIKGYKDSQVTLGNTLIDPPFEDMTFDYLLANPPFGVDWKAEKKEISRWQNFNNYEGKLPRVNDGALLFLIYMLSKRQEFDVAKNQKGTRIAVVFNGSPLFTGGAGSGESEIRRWIIENDWLETIVALPEQMFYNTGIGTFIWIISNRKDKKRQGKIQLIDSRDRWLPMKRSLGDKRRYFDQEIIDLVTLEHGEFQEKETSRIFSNSDFGFRRITVDRPLRLRFQITDEAKDMFLASYPDLEETIVQMESKLGNKVYRDWNKVWKRVSKIFKASKVTWAKGAKGNRQRKFFRDCFTIVDSKAKPVITNQGNFSGTVTLDNLPADSCSQTLDSNQVDNLFGIYDDSKTNSGQSLIYEIDYNLRDYENIPLGEKIVDFFFKEVRPFAKDAWINSSVKDDTDKKIGKVGYEINFNRVFFKYEPPRDLEVINAELAEVENKIMEMLKEVAE